MWINTDLFFTMKSMKAMKKRLNFIILFDEHYTKMRVKSQENFKYFCHTRRR